MLAFLQFFLYQASFDRVEEASQNAHYGRFFAIKSAGADQPDNKPQRRGISSHFLLGQFCANRFEEKRPEAETTKQIMNRGIRPIREQPPDKKDHRGKKGGGTRPTRKYFPARP